MIDYVLERDFTTYEKVTLKNHWVTYNKIKASKGASC